MGRKRPATGHAILACVLALATATAAHAARGRRVAIDTQPAQWQPEQLYDFSADVINGENWGPILLPAHDDAEHPMVLHIGNKTYTQIWINRNGFITLGESNATGPVVFSPTITALSDVTGDIIAPFRAPVKLRPLDPDSGPNAPGSVCPDFGSVCDLTYAVLDLRAEQPNDGDDPFDHILALRVTWGYFPTGDSLAGVSREGGDESKRISFQVKLIDREQKTGRSGDFDVELNYEALVWEGDPSLVGIKAGNVLVDFAKFYTSFLDDSIDIDPSAIAACAADGSDVIGDPASFDRKQALSCNSITVEFRNGKPDLKTYTSDLSLSLTAAAGTFHATEKFPLELSMSNGDFDTATNVQAVVTLPSGTTFDSVAPAGASCTQTGASVKCTLATLAAHASSDITLNLRSDQGGEHDFTAQIDSDQYDPDLAANSTSAKVMLEDSANLSITACNRPASVVQGSTATVTCTVRNDGPQAAKNVVLEANLPSVVTFSSGSGCTAASGKVTCTSASLASGSTADFSATLSAGATATGSASLSMSLKSDTFDPVTNNPADASFTITASPPAGGGGNNSGSSGGGGGGYMSPASLVALLLWAVASARRRYRRAFT